MAGGVSNNSHTAQKTQRAIEVESFLTSIANKKTTESHFMEC